MAVQITMEGQAPKFLTVPRYTLGRSSDCDVLLPENDGMVSRQHACLERDAAGNWWVADLGSTNGTFVNGEKINDPHALQNGDQIGIGRTQIGFLAPQAAVNPAPVAATSTPNRATETTFVTLEEVQAKLAATAPAPIAPPPITTPPPMAPPAYVPPIVASAPIPEPIPVPISESVAKPLDIPDAPRDFAEPEPAAMEVLPETNFAHAAETPWQSTAQNSPAPIAPPETSFSPVPISFSEPEPVMSVESVPLRVEEKNISSDAKQCTRCRQIYAYAEESCPACGHTGFKIKSAVSEPFDALVKEQSPIQTTKSADAWIADSFNPPIPATPHDPPIVRNPYPPQPMAPPGQPPISHVVHHVSMPQTKNSGLALLLSILCSGGGQIYNGQVGKGICIFFTAVTMALLSLIPFVGWLLWLPLVVLHIWNVVDAYKNAERINAKTANQSYNLPQ